MHALNVFFCEGILLHQEGRAAGGPGVLLQPILGLIQHLRALLEGLPMDKQVSLREESWRIIRT